MPCHAMPCYAMLCYATLCYATITLFACLCGMSQRSQALCLGAGAPKGAGAPLARLLRCSGLTGGLNPRSKRGRQLAELSKGGRGGRGKRSYENRIWLSSQVILASLFSPAHAKCPSAARHLVLALQSVGWRSCASKPPECLGCSFRVTGGLNPRSNSARQLTELSKRIPLDDGHFVKKPKEDP